LTLAIPLWAAQKCLSSVKLEEDLAPNTKWPNKCWLVYGVSLDLSLILLWNTDTFVSAAARIPCFLVPQAIALAINRRLVLKDNGNALTEL
jgi:hypothetical protein